MTDNTIEKLIVLRKGLESIIKRLNAMIKCTDNLVNKLEEQTNDR